MKSHLLQKSHTPSSSISKFLILVLASALCTVAGGFLRGARGQSSAQNVAWVNPVHTTTSGNTLQKNEGDWDAGANSQQQITAAGGYVEFSISMNHRMQVGLSNDTSAAVDYTQLKYTLNFWGDYFDIREGWENYYGWWPYQPGDVFRIAVEGNVIWYYQNGALLRTSTRSPSYPLVLDTALTSMGATVLNASIWLPSSANVKTDRGVYPEPPLPALPTAGGKFTDPTFGTEIMRVTDENDGPAPGLGTFYSTWPTFNVNSTKLLIRKGVTGDAIVKTFDPVNFTVGSGRTELPLNFGDGSGESPTWQGALWSNSDPNIIYVLSNGATARLMSYNVSGGTWSEVNRFQAQMSAGGSVAHMTMSEDDDVFACYQKDDAGQITHYIVWRRSTNTLLRHTPTGGAGSHVPAGYTVNEVDLDKSGKYLAIPFDSPAGGLQQCTTGFTGSEVGQILNLETGEVDTLRWCGSDDPPGHGGMGHGFIAGAAFFDYGINKRLLNNIHSPEKMFRPQNAAGNTDFTENFHGTMLAENEGWITIGTYDDDYDTSATDYGVFEDEIYQVALDGSQRFRRLAHTRSNWVHHLLPGANELNGYWAAPKPTISKDGRYIAFTSNWEETIGRYDLFIVKVPPAPQPDVTGSVFRPSGPVDLTSEGSLDWAHWGITSTSAFNHKAGVTQQISNYSTVGTGTPFQYGDNQFSYSWTDGTPTPSATSTHTGIAVSGLNNGFRITVPADTNTRTLRIYVGSWYARGRIEAQLSGSIGPAYSDASVGSNSGRSYGVYTINYRAQADGQTLTVTYKMTQDYWGWGNVSFQAATLSAGNVNSNSLTGLISLQDGSTNNLSQQGPSDWAHWGLTSADSFNHKAGGTQQISNYSVLGTTAAWRYTDHRFNFRWSDGTPTASTTGTTTGAFISGVPGNGFRITVPADTTLRKLKIYASVWYAKGRLEASLSDNSAPIYVDTSINNEGGSSDGVYTIVFKAASSGQTLTITYTMQQTFYSPLGNVALQAATLRQL